MDRTPSSMRSYAASFCSPFSAPSSAEIASEYTTKYLIRNLATSFSVTVSLSLLAYVFICPPAQAATRAEFCRSIPDPPAPAFAAGRAGLPRLDWAGKSLPGRGPPPPSICCAETAPPPRARYPWCCSSVAPPPSGGAGCLRFLRLAASRVASTSSSNTASLSATSTLSAAFAVTNCFLRSRTAVSSSFASFSSSHSYKLLYKALKPASVCFCICCTFSSLLFLSSPISATAYPLCLSVPLLYRRLSEPQAYTVHSPLVAWILP
mmetsp:Transcript_40030/g.93724  ORF Transcript_40030/g.93724 Transcript_40030/m.93724 type:complete len:264 (+) Transcript_40030:308-1099(+)